LIKTMCSDKASKVIAMAFMKDKRHYEKSIIWIGKLSTKNTKK